MKKLLSIILCLCVMVIPLNAVALGLPETSVITDITDDDDITTPIVEITPSDNSPEAQAIAKIHAHMRANGEEPASTMAQASGLIDGGIYNIKNYFSGKYLNVCYGTDANGTNVYQYTKDGSVEQKFKVVYDSSTDSYKLHAMCSSNGNNRVIDVKRGGAALASGQNVDIWTPVDHTAQRVEITYLTYNIYHIRMKANTGLYLTTRDSSNGTKAGTSATSAGNVHINSFDVNLNQQWAFEYLGTATPEPEPEPEPEPTVVALSVNQTYSATLSLNDEHTYSFSPSQTGTYVVQTTGDTDTYGTVNITINGTVVSETDDDDGEGYNFNIMFYATSGDTIEIKVRTCYPASQEGSYSIKIHRARAQIYTFNYGWSNINTTTERNIPLSGLSQLGYDAVSNINAASAHANEINTNGYANLNSEFVFFSGHGQERNDYQTALCFYNENDSYDELTSRSLPSNMNNVKVALWSACYSGQQVNENNVSCYSVAESAYDRGAKVSIGWKTEISNSAAQKWNNAFLYYLCLGNDVEMSMVYANSRINLEDSVIQSQVVYGDIGVVVEPITFLGNVDLEDYSSLVLNNVQSDNFDYVEKSLPFGVKRYIKVVNGFETNDYYDVAPNGTVFYSENTITQEDLNDIEIIPTSSVFSVYKNNCSTPDNYSEAYYKINGEIRHVGIKKSGEGIVYIDLSNGCEIRPEYIYQ